MFTYYFFRYFIYEELIKEYLLNEDNDFIKALVIVLIPIYIIAGIGAIIFDIIAIPFYLLIKIIKLIYKKIIKKALKNIMKIIVTKN